LAFSAWNVRNSQIDKTHLEFDGVNQVQMLFKEVVEDPNSDYKTFDKMVQTAKQNILWHGLYHLPNQIIPGIDLLKIKEMSMGNWLSVILCLIILLAITPLKRSSFALILVISPILIMVMMMPIGGSERYWGMISMLCILLIASNISLVISKTTSTKFKAAINTVALLAIIMQSISIINYVYQHEKNPYHSEGNATELATFFELNRDFCFANGIRSDITVLTPHNAAFQLISGCSAPEVNENLGINPLFTHVIIRSELRSIKGRVVASYSPWSLVELNTPQYRKSLIK
jgi:hypothetical protein